MTRKHSDWLRAYMEYSGVSEAPDKFHLWTGVSVIAGALRGKVRINQGYFIWPTNFYIVFVAPPGIVQKSTTAEIGMDLLRNVPGINFGPDVVTWQELARSFAAAAEAVEFDDGTYRTMSAITVVSSELGNFLNPNDREMIDFLVHLWDGREGVVRKATKTMGEDVITNPWINMLGCTTPAWIAGNVPEYVIGGGFMSRCIFVYAENKRQLVAYPGEVLPANFQKQKEDLIHDLEVISQLKGAVRLTNEAKAWGEAWYEHHYENNIKGYNDAHMAAYYARKQTHMHKLATIISASESDSLIIEPHHLQVADSLLQSVEADMPKVFSQIGKTTETRAIEELISHIWSVREEPMYRLYQRFSKFLTSTQFDEVTKSAERTGRVQKVQRPSGTYMVANLASVEADPPPQDKDQTLQDLSLPDQPVSQGSNRE